MGAYAHPFATHCSPRSCSNDIGDLLWFRPSVFFSRSSNADAVRGKDQTAGDDERPADGPRHDLLPPRAPAVTPLPTAAKTQTMAEQQCSGFRFPNCRTVLWDSSEKGPKVFVGVEDILPDVTVPAHVLSRLQGALAEPDSPLGTLQSAVRADGASLRYEVHGYATETDGGATEVADGVPLTLSNAESEPEGGQSKREAAARAQLATRSPTAVDALLRPHFAAEIARPSSTSDQFRLRISAEVSAPSATLVATPIRSLRILQTPLSKSLAASQSVRAVAARAGGDCSAHADDMRAGYVTVDACRRCVAMHVNDAKTWEWPLVGVWVSDAESVYDSLVWAACLRFCHCSSISERVAQNGAFLLLLYVRGQRSPQMYEWRLSPEVADGDAAPVRFESFKSPMELPLSTLRSDAAADAPFEFSLGRKVPRGARGDSSSRNRDAFGGTQAAASAGPSESAATMACPEPSAPPSPATLSFVAAATECQPRTWSPLRVHQDALPLTQADLAASAAAVATLPASSLLPTQQVAAQQAKIDRLEDIVRQLQQQLSVLSQNVQPSRGASTTAAEQTSAATNTSFLWQNEAMQHQLSVLNQDVPPRAATAAAATSTSGFLWQRQQELDGSSTVADAAAELQKAISRFGDSQQEAMPSHAQLSATDSVGEKSATVHEYGRRVCVEPTLSPARSARPGLSASPSKEEQEPATEVHHDSKSAQVESSGRVDCSASSDDDERFADRNYDYSTGNYEPAGSLGQVADPATPARPQHTFQLPSAAATPPSPPEPVWRSMLNYCADLNVSTIGTHACT
jgi:hypothetical protein